MINELNKWCRYLVVASTLKSAQEDEEEATDFEESPDQSANGARRFLQSD